MTGKTKSGKEVIDEFFANVPNIKGVDNKTVEKLISLYNEKKFTDTNIQNAMDELLQEELKLRDETDGKD